MKEITLDLQHSTSKPTPPRLFKSLSSSKPKESAAEKDVTVIDRKGKKKSKPRLILRIVLAIFLVGIVAAGYFGYRSNRALNFMGINTNPSATIANVIKQKDPELKKDDQNRTNLLIVGIDTRPNNPGLQNTDTIMMASFNHTTNDTILVSIPRDILVGYPDNPYYFTKINAIYNYCERSNTGTGMQCLADTVQSLTGLTTQYWVLVDVTGMISIIDELGGVDVDVERAFTDYMFPTPDNLYETIHFDAGLQHMDGETAMKYARSRHAQSVEGSDYARARRQQKVVAAAKEKAFTLDTLKNPLTIVEMLEELGKSITISDISTEDIRAAIALSDKIEDKNTYNVVLDPMLGNWQLISENPAGPKLGLGDWSAVNTYLNTLYQHPALYTIDKDVYVYNAGLGYDETYQEYLRITEAFPYLSIIFGGNSSVQTLTGTHVYNFEAEPAAIVLDEYATFFGSEWTSTLPEGLTSINGEQIAILFGAPEPTATTDAEEPATTE
jgi:LCP family protein required for cell wall assembly